MHIFQFKPLAALSVAATMFSILASAEDNNTVNCGIAGNAM
jgi:hypothetical protein